MFDLSSQDMIGIVVAGCIVLAIVFFACIAMGACVEWFERMDGEDK